MKLALIGCGAMGKLVAAQASENGDEIGLRLSSTDASKSFDELVEALRGHDAAIDFSVADAVIRNVELCARARVPLVEGTTGWNDREADVRKLVDQNGATLVYGANFSIGVNIFYRIVSQAAKLLSNVDGYGTFIEEEHHMRKKDAPSGTALRLQALMNEFIKTEIPVASVRAGHIPGTHKIGFDSAADQITLTHTARSRAGFAAGALMAAHWVVGKKGVFEFSDVIDEILSK